MDFIPIDTSVTEPSQGGRGGLPEGMYIMQLTDAQETKMELNGDYKRRLYKCVVLRGPGNTQDMINRKFTHGLRENDPIAAPHHMALFVACFGTIEAVRQVAVQHGNVLPSTLLHGKTFLAKLYKNGNFTNVEHVLPYTAENWAEHVTDAPVGATGGIVANAAAAAPAPAAVIAAQPAAAVGVVAPQMPPTMPVPAAIPAPAAVAMPAVAPQLPTLAAGPPMVVPGAPAVPAAIPAPVATPAAAAPGIPTPPPPPGFPGVGVG